MTLLKTTITAESNFVTQLQGDTLFGQICWSIRFRLGQERLENLLQNYESEPFLIVSDGFAPGYLPKPTLPSVLLGEDPEKKKVNRKRVWLTLDELQNGEYTKAKKDEDANNKVKIESIVKNSINYKTFTTGEGFDPFSEEEYRFKTKDIYFLLDENRMKVLELEEVLKSVGEMGFGKKSTIGKGRFSASPLIEINLPKKSSTTYMLLSSINAFELDAKSFFYDPITKFGKHGALLSTQNPFKKPLLLAKSGSVVVFEQPKEIEYLGKAIRGHSTHKETIHQGYAIALPIAEIENGE